MYAVIRIRGHAKFKRDIEDTMCMLHLHRPNHCIILQESDSTRGMLNKVKDFVTWGEIEKDTLVKLLTERGKLVGDMPLSNEWLSTSTSFKTIDELASALLDGKVNFTKLEGMKHILRLPPPVKGFEGTKRHFTVGGALGYRGKEINELIGRMLISGTVKKEKKKPQLPAGIMSLPKPREEKPKVKKPVKLKTVAQPKPKTTKKTEVSKEPDESKDAKTESKGE